MGSVVRLVVSDIDDTLIARNASGVPRRTAASIQRFLDSGRWFAPVTGRSFTDAQSMFSGCPAGCATGAFANGQEVYVEGSLVHQELVASSTLQKIAGFLDEGEVACNPLLYLGDQILALTARPQRLACTPENERCTGWISDLGELAVPKANIQCGCAPQEVPALVERLSRQFEDVDFVQPGQVPEIDVAPKGWNKAKGIQVLAEHLGVGLGEILAIGDSDNDVAMLRYVPKSYAVASGTPAARRAAAYQLPGVGQEPVALVLEGILAGKTSEDYPC